MGIDFLLISNTKVAGRKLLDHARKEIPDILKDAKVVTFIPYANPDGIGPEKYLEVLAPTFHEMGYELKLITEGNERRDIRSAQAFYVGGGNTWHLLSVLKRYNLLDTLKTAVEYEVPYIGSSAGSNIAGISIGNTNDMPAADPHGLEAMGLVPFNINPHYQDKVTLTAEEREAALAVAPQLAMLIDHQGETREGRIKEYHALGNEETVVALRERAMLRVTNGKVYLKGDTGAKIFRPNQEPIECQSGCLNHLL